MWLCRHAYKYICLYIYKSIYAHPLIDYIDRKIAQHWTYILYMIYIGSFAGHEKKTSLAIKEKKGIKRINSNGFSRVIHWLKPAGDHNGSWINKLFVETVKLF